MLKKIFSKNQGFSIVEVLVSVMIVSVLTLSIYSLIILSLRITSDNKHYVAATFIANQKMENIRNLSYSSIGTIAGWPVGSTTPHEVIYQDDGIYSVDTSIEYADDPFDGTAASSTDAVPNDYKNVTIKVSWNSGYGLKSISVFSKFIPPTEETLDGQGILLLTVVDANGNPVSDATIHIYASTTIPIIDQEFTSNSEGRFTYTFPPAYEGYEIRVTKEGYSEDRTYPKTTENPNPTRPNLTIEEDEKTTDSFTIDLMSTLKIYTVQANLPENWQASNDDSLKTQSNAKLTFDNSGNVYVVWEDYRQNTKPELFAQKYDTTTSPPTKKWSGTYPDIRIRTAANQILPDVKIDPSGNLYVCWNDDSNGNQDAYLDKRLSATGAPDPAWSGELKIETVANSNDQTNPRIAVNNLGETMLYVVWQDDRNGNSDLFYQQYNSAKTPLLSPEKNVNSNAGSDSSNQTLPNIVLDSVGDIYFSWTDDRDGNLDIYGAKFSSSTKTMVWEKRLTNLGSADTFDQYLSDTDISDDNFIYVVWTDERNGNQDIYAQKIDTSGNNQWASDLKVSISSSTVARYSPAIAFDNNSDVFYVVWTDERNGNQDIYAQKIDTNGNRLWASGDVRINISTSTSNEYNPDITINPYNHHPYATWQSDVNGDLDIFISPFDQYTITNYLSSVPLIITGSKKIGENPIIYKHNISTTTNASGLVSIPIEWDSVGYSISLGSSYTVHSLYYADPSLPLVIQPNEVKNLFLYLE